MPNNSQLHRTWLRSALVRLCRVNFLLLLGYAISVAVFDSAHLMPPEVIMRRAMLASIALLLVCVIWFSAHKEQAQPVYYKRLVYALIGVGIMFAAISVYTDRGVASRDVALFALPIIGSAALVNRSALYGVAIASSAAYFAASMRYYYDHPNEMLHVEIYGMLAFHILVFFAIAGLLWVVARARK